MSGAALTISDLTAGYRRRTVLDALSVPPIAPGKLTALVGPNAAGKTTLLRSLAGLIKARGSVKLGDVELLGLSPARHAALVTYMPQSLPQRVALNVLEAVLAALHASPLDGDAARDPERRALETLDRLGVSDLALRPLDELSGGQRQLASLAQAVARAPKVLLLDEPTSALDLGHAHAVMTVVQELVRERGIIAVAVLHDIGLAARFADRVVMLNEGGVLADGPAEIAISPHSLARAYGVRARIERCSQGRLTVCVDGPLEHPA